MSVQVIDNFSYKGKKGNFERDNFDTLQAMRSYPEDGIDDGHVCFCNEDGNHYKFNHLNSVDGATGRWRLHNKSVNTLTETGEGKVLDARQGKILKDLIDAKVIEAGGVSFDTVPTKGSTNPVTSNGIKEAMDEQAKSINSNTGVDDYPVFSASEAYSKGKVVNYNGKLYKFTADHAAGAWIGTDVEKTDVVKAHIVQELGDNETKVVSQNTLSELLFSPKNISIYYSKNLSILESDSTEENSIIVAGTGKVVSVDNVNLISVSVKSGDILFLDIKDKFDDYYAIFSFFDKNGNRLFSQAGGDKFNAQKNRFIFIPFDVILKYSSRVNNPNNIFLLGSYDIEEFNSKKSYIQKETSLPSISTLDRVYIDTNSSRGIFENTEDTNYITSDFIELNDKYSYFLINKKVISEYDTFRLYDSNKELLVGYSLDYIGITKINVLDAKYIKFVSNSDNDIILYKNTSNFLDTDTIISSIFNKNENVEASEKGLEGIYGLSGNLTYSPLRWHTIFKAGKGFYKVTTQTGLDNGKNDKWYAIAFLDSNKQVIGGYTDKNVETQFLKDYLIIAPDNTEYISISIYNIDYLPILKHLTVPNTDELKKYVNELIYPTTHSVLWLGTSIPEGCPYPQNACKNLGYTCYNMALGSSGISKYNGVLGNDRDGRDLAESTEEKIERYKDHIGDGIGGTITQERYNEMMNWGYDKRIIPYINGNIASCDMVVFDHGYNDRWEGMEDTAADNYFDTLDLSIDKEDDEFDRGNIIGGFCFLVKKIWEINPNIKIIICSYLENKTGSPEFPEDKQGKRGYGICLLLKKIAKHFNFPYLNMCDYNGFTLEYVPNTSNYITDFNRNNGTNYSILNYTGKINKNNNVTKFQYYCPDGTHPHTDKSQRAEKILTETITKLLRDL